MYKIKIQKEIKTLFNETVPFDKRGTPTTIGKALAVICANSEGDTLKLSILSRLFASDESVIEIKDKADLNLVKDLVTNFPVQIYNNDIKATLLDALEDAKDAYDKSQKKNK